MRTILALVAFAVFSTASPAPTFAGPTDKQPSNRSPFLSAGSSKTGPLWHLWHYIGTHKELLAADAVVVAAWSADASSTVYDEHHCVCVEQNALLGKNPSAGAVWSYAIGAAGAQVGVNHLVWHYAPDHSDQHLLWFVMAPLVGMEASNIYSNVQAADIAPLGRQSSKARISYGLGTVSSQFSVWPTVSSGQGNRFAALRRPAMHTGVPR